MKYLILSFLIIKILYGSAIASDKGKYTERFIQVPAGCFLMGNTFEDPYHTEMPVHKVCLDSFSISSLTVTRREFKQFVAETDFITDAEKSLGCYIYNGTFWEKMPSANWRSPGFNQEENHPAVCVSWNDADAYAAWLSKKTGIKYRLPTEAEWEYAARSAGKQEKVAGGDNIDNFAWYLSNSGNSTHAVGQKQPNGLGLYDMSGNVWQWVGDWFNKGYYRTSPIANPVGPESGTKRVFRG
ncbi:MAG: SUMF1/EgtB/PvdO family nonheme iron enzyme, partial [Desulfuromonadaceae bacterium]|nr:SUMF1/EgtB/PvdO family nonheme iron enzyme [Desulfuromonadaceae bacterium]